MRMNKLQHLMSAVAIAGGMTLHSLAPAGAVPLIANSIAMKPPGASIATEVRWYGHHGGGGGAALAAGLATGLLMGGLFAAPGYYGGPYAYYGSSNFGPVGFGAPDWQAYCFSRYRSFDPGSGTYLGYDGRRHYCR